MCITNTVHVIKTKDWANTGNTAQSRPRPICLRKDNLPCSSRAFSSSVSLQLTGAAPSWHPGDSDSPASLCEKRGRGKGGRVGGKRRGRDESKHHQRDRMTFLRAQGLLITGGLGLMHRDSQMMKEKTNETFCSTAKRD